MRYIPGRGQSGGHLYARPSDRERRRPVQLLVGHCDTVWPLGTLASMPLEVRDDRIKGPGAYDMKGGLTQLVFALQAIHALGITPTVTPVVFINSDEEIGSHESRPFHRMLARRPCRAFVLEPSLGLSGKLKTARKGAGDFVIRIVGRSAHAGLDSGAGASAILELSHLIQQLNALNDPERGITVNIGRVDGGIRPNVVAPTSTAWVDVRVRTAEDARRVEDAIRRLEPAIPGTRIEVEGAMDVPPLEPTRATARSGRPLGGSPGRSAWPSRRGRPGASPTATPSASKPRRSTGWAPWAMVPTRRMSSCGSIR